MKRAIFDTAAVLPFTSGSIADRTGFESAVLAVTVAAGKTAAIKVEHSDAADGTFEAVKDSRLFIDNPVNADGAATIANTTEAEAVANLNIDLIGCKAFVKITATDGTIGALVLGDATDHPVKAGEIKTVAPKAATPPTSGTK